MKPMNSTIRIGIADDHQLFVKSVSLLLHAIGGFEVVLEAANGHALMDALAKSNQPPDIILLDVNMPLMNGIETAAALIKTYPLIKVVALSMNTDDISLIGMIRNGCCAYLMKDISPAELQKALEEVHSKGYYNSENMQHNMHKLMTQNTQDLFSEKELQFIKLACSDDTYREIAQQMKVSERSVDMYREKVFEKLGVSSRTGMALEAVRRKIYSL
jgi:DNA-binding NarL/FixJ family response regulator